MRCAPEWRVHSPELPGPSELPQWVVAEDSHLLVFNKPGGLLSVPGRGPENADCLSARAQARWPDALVVHRLDMGTSGLLLMARGPQAQRALSEAFAQRRTHKRYEALVHGHVDTTQHAADPNGWHTIALPLVVDWPNRPRSKVCHQTGKPSLTRWRVLESGVLGRYTRLELEPVTGRSHQLRVHLLSIGHPIVGDALYAPEAGAAEHTRLMLHATDLSVPHPHTQVMQHWHCPASF